MPWYHCYLHPVPLHNMFLLLVTGSWSCSQELKITSLPLLWFIFQTLLTETEDGIELNKHEYTEDGEDNHSLETDQELPVQQLRTQVVTRHICVTQVDRHNTGGWCRDTTQVG